MCQIDTGEGCWGYMCNECQEDWNKDRAFDRLFRQAEKERDLMVAAIQKWREGRAHLGIPMTYADQRLIDTTRTIIGDARAAKVEQVMKAREEEQHG